MNFVILCCSSSLQLVGLELGPLLESVPGVSNVTCVSTEEWENCDDESAILLVWVDASFAELIESFASCFCQELVKKLWGRRVWILFDAASHEKGRRMDILSSIFPTCVFEGPQSVDKILEVWETTRSREDSLRSIQRSIDYCTGTGTSTLAEISDWMETKRERVLVVTGPLGSGKSVLLAQTCWRSGYFLDAETGNPARRVVAACFLSSDTSAKLCIMTLADQLCSSFPTLEIEGEAKLESMDPLVLFRRFIAEPLMKMKPKPQERAFVVIDGIDQTPWTEREDLVQAIVAQWERLIPDWLDLIVSTRPHLIPLMEGIRFSCLHLSEEERRRDIEVCMQKVSEHFLLPQLPASPERGCNPWEWMTEKCQGWFPWLRALLACLKDVPPRTMTLLDAWFLDVPTNVLDSFIWQSLEQFLVGPLQDDLELYRTLFSALAVARTPLEASTVQTLLALDGFTIRESFFAELELILGVGDQGIQLCHQAFATFLLDNKKSAIVVSKESMHVGKSLHVPAEYGRRALVQVFHQNPTAPDAVRELLFQLCSIGDWNTVRDHLCDFDWVFALVSIKGATETVIADLEKMYVWEDFADQQVLEVIQVLRDEMYTLCEHPDNLPMKLFSGIADWDHPILKSYAVSQHAEKVRPFLPVKAPPQSLPQRRTYSNPTRMRADNETILDLKDLGLTALGFHENMLIGATNSRLLFIWEFSSGRLISSIEYGSDFDLFIGWNQVHLQGTMVVCCCSSQIYWANWDTGETFEIGLREQPHVIAVSIWGQTIVVATDGSLFIWDVSQNGNIRYLLRRDFSIRSAAIHKGHIVSGSKNGEVKLWSTRTGNLLATLRGHLSVVKSVAILDDLVVSVDDTSVRLWRVSSCESLHVFDVLVGGPVAVSPMLVSWFERKDETSKTGNCPTSLVVWNRRTDTFWSAQDDAFDFDGHSPVIPVHMINSVVSVHRRKACLWDQRSHSADLGDSDVFASSASEGLIVCSLCDGKKVRVLSAATGDLLRELNVSGTHYIALSEGRLLKAVSESQELKEIVRLDPFGFPPSRVDPYTLQVLDVVSGACLHEFHCQEGEVELHLSDRFAVSVRLSSFGQNVHIWRLDIEKLDLLPQRDVDSVALEGRDLVSLCWRTETVSMWDLESFTCKWSAPHQNVVRVALSGMFVFSVCLKELWVWHRETGELLQTLDWQGASLSHTVASLTAHQDTVALATQTSVVIFVLDPKSNDFNFHSDLHFKEVSMATLTSVGALRVLAVQTKGNLLLFNMHSEVN